jgi:hypothetical protein
MTFGQYPGRFPVRATARADCPSCFPGFTAANESTSVSRAAVLRSVRLVVVNEPLPSNPGIALGDLDYAAAVLDLSWSRIGRGTGRQITCSTVQQARTNRRRARNQRT